MQSVTPIPENSIEAKAYMFLISYLKKLHLPHILACLHQDKHYLYFIILFYSSIILEYCKLLSYFG